MANWEHYDKVTKFKDLSNYFFEYVLRLELENKDLKERIGLLKSDNAAKNPYFKDIVSNRTYNCIKSFFKEKNCHFDIRLFDVYNLDFKQLKKIKGLGYMSLNQIQVVFNEYGLPEKRKI
jgi:hypothetical protein